MKSTEARSLQTHDWFNGREQKCPQLPLVIECLQGSKVEFPFLNGYFGHSIGT